MSSKDIDEKAQMLLKDAFKRFLREQLGPIKEKPPVELRAWSLALLELSAEVRSHQLNLEDEVLYSE